MPNKVELTLELSTVRDSVSAVPLEPEPQVAESLPEKAQSNGLNPGVKLPPSLVTPPQPLSAVSEGPSRVIRIPAKYGDYEGYSVLTNDCLYLL